MANDKPRRKPPFVRSEAHSLQEDHTWRSSPGHKICVLGRGDLRFEYPEGWVTTFGENSIKLHDHAPPRDDMVLEVSVVRMPLLDWAMVPPLDVLLQENLKAQGEFLTPDQIRVWNVPGLDGAWAEYPRVEEDPATHLPREAIWKQAHCHPGRFHKGSYLPLGILTFGCWIEHWERADPVWRHVLETIVMGETIADPRRGPRYH